MSNPIISVVMSVYNGEKYLQEAIDSILSQTFKNFEFIIIDDGSNDKSLEIISSYDDKRIVLIKNEMNLGLAISLNRGLKLARGKYIARMDADDISLPGRLEKQIQYLEEHSEVDVCGSYLDAIGEGATRHWKYPTKPNVIKVALMFYSPLAHPSIMARKVFFNKAKYNTTYQNAQDYHLWASESSNHSYANIPEVLLLYRLHNSQAGETSKTRQLTLSNIIRRHMLDRFGVQVTEAEFKVHVGISCYESIDMLDAEKWLIKLYLHNQVSHMFEDEALKSFLDDKWWMIANNSANNGLKTFYVYQKSNINFLSKSLMQNLKLFIKCLIRYQKKN